MLRALYDWTMQLGASRHAVWALVLIAFIESSFFPIPVDLLLIPMILAARERAWRLASHLHASPRWRAAISDISSGSACLKPSGDRSSTSTGSRRPFARFTERYNEMGAWIVAVFGVTPFPYKVVTIASGVTQLDPLVFGIASLGSRGLRFFLVAALIWYFGPPIRLFVEKYLGWVALAFVVLLIGGFVLIKYAF